MVAASPHIVSRLLLAGVAAAVSAAASAATAAAAAVEPACDVLVAGGSLASLAAAIAAANASLALARDGNGTGGTAASSVCLLEITDWLGGQATASATSAIDLGSTWAAFPANLNGVFAAGLTSPALGPAGFNPGGCTVSTKCFLPALFVAWADALAASLPNLRVYRATAVTAVGRQSHPPGGNATGRVTSVTAVRRTPTPAHAGGWDRNLSAALPDWYSADPSDFFTKEVLEFTVPPTGVVVEATEFGDVLLLGALGVTQGGEEVEAAPLPSRQSCGGATTVCFYASWDAAPAPSPDPWPRGSDGGHVIHYYDDVASLNHSLTWRRSLAADPADVWTPRLGDVALLNENNDEDYAYLFLPVEEARATALLGQYAGGVDLIALAMAEARSFYFYQIILDALPHFLPAAAGHFALNASAAGTQTGLAKMPYVRDTRRAAAGVDGFRLCHQFASPNGTGPGPVGCGTPSDRAAAAAAGPSSATVGYKWQDRVAIGSYDFDIHRLRSCELPAYLNFCYPSCSEGRERTQPRGAIFARRAERARARRLTATTAALTLDHRRPHLCLSVSLVPYYLPWRALTHAEAPNLLLAGKTMSQSFYANAITRLHPSEWSSGAAAGAGAALMAARAWDSADVLANIGELQALLVSDAVRNPIEWTGL